MAVIDDTTNDKVREELKAIDINDTSLPEGLGAQINPDADAWGRTAPPPDGAYLVRLFESKTPYQMGKTDDGKDVFYRANLECPIQDEGEWKDTKIFSNVSTYISSGKEISTMIAILRKCAPTLPIPEKPTPLQVLRLFRKVIAQQPKLYCIGEWKAWDRHKNEHIKVGMKTFPSLGDGKFNHVIKNSKGEDVNASFKVNRWFGLKEYKAILEADKLRKSKQGAQAPSVNLSNGSKSEVVVDDGFAPVSVSAPVSNVADSDFVIDE